MGSSTGGGFSRRGRHQRRGQLGVAGGGGESGGVGGGVRRERGRGEHHCLEAPVGTSVKRLKGKLDLICLEIVLILMQDRCMICKEHTICLENNLDPPNGTPK